MLAIGRCQWNNKFVIPFQDKSKLRNLWSKSVYEFGAAATHETGISDDHH